MTRYEDVPTWYWWTVAYMIPTGFLGLRFRDTGIIFGWPLIGLAFLAKFVGIVLFMIAVLAVDTARSTGRHVRNVFRQRWLVTKTETPTVEVEASIGHPGGTVV